MGEHWHRWIGWYEHMPIRYDDDSLVDPASNSNGSDEQWNYMIGDQNNLNFGRENAKQIRDC